MTIDIQNIKTLNNVSQFNFSCQRMIFTLLELEAVCDDSCWSPQPCSLTSSIWPSGCRTVGCPSMTLIPESLVASSSSSCSYSYIIINNTYYTHEQLENSGWVQRAFQHLTIKSYLFIWPCLWKNSKQYYDKFVNHRQSEKQAQKFHTDDASLSRPG